MTVKIIDEDIYAEYQIALHQETKFEAFCRFTQYVRTFANCDDRFMQELMNVINALMADEPVELVEPKYYAYMLIPHSGVLNALQISHGVGGYGNTFISTPDFYDESRYQFTQLEVDMIKKVYPHIKTKEVDD